MSQENGKILIIDDDEYVRLSLKMLLEQYYTILAASHPSQIEEHLNKEEQFDVVLLDMNFKHGATSGEEGLSWLKKIKSASPQTSVILITAYADVETAVEGIQLGAMDFIVKPWQNEKLLATVKAAKDLAQEKHKVEQLKEKQQNINSAACVNNLLIGKSFAMDDIKKMIRKISSTEATILITGENGTGKEVVAREIHNQSERKKEVFMAVDLGAISEQLFESELFGHVKGAFTDARENRIGRIETASGGTLFLDEIGNLNPSMQSKLLTVLQRKEVIPVGGNAAKPVDIRVICATNSNLAQMVKEGKFREDLLYRINTMTIDIPSLRERPDDIDILADYFLNKYKVKYRKPLNQISADGFQSLKRYSWPGNVRELEHAIERAVIMSEGNELTDADFQFLNSDFKKSPAFDDLNLESLEEWAIRQAIKKHNGNVSHAADELGLSRGALYRRMEKYGI